MKESNTKIYINNAKYEFKINFCPKKEGIYTIKIYFYFSFKDCSYMFYKCDKIIKVDLTYFEKEKITNMEGMFYYCCNLQNID